MAPPTLTTVSNPLFLLIVAMTEWSAIATDLQGLLPASTSFATIHHANFFIRLFFQSLGLGIMILLTDPEPRRIQMLSSVTRCSTNRMLRAMKTPGLFQPPVRVFLMVLLFLMFLAAWILSDTLPYREVRHEK